MSGYNFQEISAITGIFLVFFLALFLLTVKTKYRVSNLLLAFFLLLNAIDGIKFLMRDFPVNHIDLEAFRWTFVYLVPATFYLYVLSVCYSNFKLKPRHLLHAIPFVAYSIYLIVKIFTVDLPSKILFLNQMNDTPLMQFFQFLFEFLFQLYFIASFLAIRKARIIYLENYTNPNISALDALKKITILYYALHFIVLIRWLVTFIFGLGEIRSWIVMLDGFAFLFCTCWYLFVALHNPEFFRGVNSDLEPIGNKVPILETETLKLDEKKEEIQALNDFMLEREPYLDSSLTIQDLAEKVQIPVKDLSTLINLYMGKHFFDFVNEYRIQKAMQILKDPDQQQLTVLEILYEVGFNSKSSFNTSFKKQTGKTPTEYRKELL